MSLGPLDLIGALGIPCWWSRDWGVVGAGHARWRTRGRRPPEAELPPFNFEIRTLSNRADLISDGDALVEVQVPKTVPMTKVMLTLNGADVQIVVRR